MSNYTKLENMTPVQKYSEDTPKFNYLNTTEV